MAGSVAVDLTRIRAQIDEQAEARTIRLANRVLNRARREAPVDTGQLRSSGRLIVGRYIEVVFDAEHAIYVHDGTRYMRARPFLTDAAREELRRGV